MDRSRNTLLASFIFGAILTGIIFFSSSCNKAPNNGVPIYVHVDSSKVVSNNFFGSASCAIPGVWALTGSHDLGGYEIPVDIPVLAGGNVQITLNAGIYDNGIVNAPAKYPFYFPDTFTIYNAIPGHVYHHKPVYTYVPYTQVGLNETFDDNTSKFSDITILTNTADSSVYEGLRSGGIVLPSGVDSVIALQTVPMLINTGGREAYLEMNYKLNNPNTQCDVSLVITYPSTGAQTIVDKLFITNPIGQWNKVYVNFDSEIGSNPTYDFQIQLTGFHTRGQQDTVYLDNIKLLYFTN
jgi:hypothetical protein